jgi:hypothetical protein
VTAVITDRLQQNEFRAPVPGEFLGQAFFFKPQRVEIGFSLQADFAR